LRCAAYVHSGTWILVVAGRDVRNVEAPHLRVTVVVGTRVVVVAVSGRTGVAVPLQAVVILGAEAAVGARLAVVGVEAAAVRVAGVGGAGVAVVAVQGGEGDAPSILAVVADGAGVVVGAFSRIGDVHALLGLMAVVIGAGVVVIAVAHCSRVALALEAGIAERARVLVGARLFVVRVYATGDGVAGVGGAGVTVAAGQRRAHAGALHAHVPIGACVGVVAGSLYQVCEEAAGARDALVGGAGVAIEAGLFVNGAVTIVVLSIAGLGLGDLGCAWTKAALSANTLAFAVPEGVG